MNQKIKVAIITFQRAHNYGSILQSYALSRYINTKEGYECEIIDYSNDAQIEMYRVFRKKKSVHNIIRNIVTLLAYRQINSEFSAFENFIQRELPLTDKSYHNYKDLENIEAKYDVFVAGSDQIWNVKCPDADDVYFLNFIKSKKKIAYAPSFGAENIAEVLPQKVGYYTQLFNQFSALSIREKNGQKWLGLMTGKEPKLLIDPTLFYDAGVWKELMSPNEVKKPYILYYSFHFSQEINKAVKHISELLGLPVLILNSRAWIFSGCKFYGYQLIQHAGPDVFIRAVNDATYVLSNSFHGTVFSTIFHKKFWFLYGSVQAPMDDRAITLVEQLGIQNRVLRLDDIDKRDLTEIIDYSSVECKLENLRREAFEYLDSNLII